MKKWDYYYQKYKSTENYKVNKEMLDDLVDEIENIKKQLTTPNKPNN